MALVLGARQKRLLPVGKLKIDWSHPLANGLVACYVPGVSGGINLVGGLGGDLSPVTAANNTDTTVEGPSLKTLTAADGLNALAPAAFLGSTNSFYWRGFLDDTAFTNNNVQLLGIIYSDPDGSPFIFQSLAVSNANGGAISLSWDATGFHATSSQYLSATAQMQSLGGTFKPGGNAVLYVSGVQNTSDAYGAGNPRSTATSKLCLSTSQVSDAGNVLKSSCNIACMWNRELSAAEMALLDADPYGFLMPAEGEMPSIFLPSAGGSFLAAWARNSNLPVIGTGNY